MKLKNIGISLAVISTLAFSQTYAATCYTFNYSLGIGSKRTQDVIELQNFLLSYNGGALTNPNTYIKHAKYDRYTANLVKLFQKSQGISQTGTLGPATRRAINAVYSCGVAPVAPVSTTPVTKTFNFNNKTWDRANVSLTQESSDEFPYYTTYYYLKGENVSNFSEYIAIDKIVKTKAGVVPNVFNEAINLGYIAQNNEDYIPVTRPVDVHGDGKEFSLSYINVAKKLNPVFVVVRMYQKGDSVVEIFYVVRTNAMPEIKALADVYKSKINNATTTWTSEELQARATYIQNVEFAIENKEREIVSVYNSNLNQIPSDQDIYNPKESAILDLRYSQ